MGSPRQVKKGLNAEAPARAGGIPRLRRFALRVMPLLAGAFAVAAFGAEPLPSGQEVMRLVRMAESAQNHSFLGSLRTSSSRKKVVVPFQLTMQGNTFTYRFLQPPAEALVLRLEEKGSRLERVTGSGKTQTVAGAKLDDPVRGTDLTYEDLALKFLYWSNARVVGEETVMTRRCWVVQAHPADKDDSQYDGVRLWVEKTGGLLRAECYRGNRLIKRFEVRRVQRIRGGYVLKSLNIQRADAGGRSTTTLELKEP